MPLVDIERVGLWEEVTLMPLVDIERVGLWEEVTLMPLVDIEWVGCGGGHSDASGRH